MKISTPRATSEQIRYIEQLAIDLQLNRKARNILVSDKIQRNIAYLDELFLPEASTIIGYFKELKDAGKTDV